MLTEVETVNESGIEGLYPKYQNYAKQKCFIAYSEQAYWLDDLLSACEEVLEQPEYELEIDYARNHFETDIPLRQKALELIANARYGIYDISYWRKDHNSPWQMPRNVMIELGIAIALNRPTLLLRHASNQELSLSEGLQSFSNQILEFSGTKSLKQSLSKHVSKWIDAVPETAWWNRYCSFGRQRCRYRELHPKVEQFGKKELNCTVADGVDPNRSDFRDVVEDVLERFGDVSYTYLDSLSLAEGYNFLLCSYCQMTRSAPFAIYRINSHTPAEAFISMGMSLALETQFEYKIPKIIITEDLQFIPSLLAGYEVFVVQSDKERKKSLKYFMPKVLKKVRNASWKPRALPFIETTINVYDINEPGELTEVDDKVGDPAVERLVYVEGLSSEATIENIREIFQEWGEVVQIYLPVSPDAYQKLNLALIEMKEVSEAEAAAESLGGAELIGQDLTVRKAISEDLIYLNSEYKSNGISVETSDAYDKQGPPDNIEIGDSLQERETSKTIYIGNLSFVASESDVRSVFSEYGEVVRISLPVDRETGRKRGFAFVEMMKANEATRAVAELDGAEWLGRELKVNLAKARKDRQENHEKSSSVPDPKWADELEKLKQMLAFKATPSQESTSPNSQKKTIYVGNLSFSATESDLVEIFSEYGKVQKVSLPADRETGRKRGFAFIEMEDELSAKRAIEALDEAEWMGREMRVNLARPRSN